MDKVQNIDEVVVGAFLLDDSISAKEYLDKPILITEVMDAQTSYGKFLLLKGFDGTSGEPLLLRSGATAVVNMLSSLVGESGLRIALKLVKVGRAYRPAPLSEEELEGLKEVMNHVEN